jgi:hypothetical protein
VGLCPIGRTKIRATATKMYATETATRATAILGDVFLDSLELQRGLERALATAGAFRVVSERDLFDARERSSDPRDDYVRGLRDQGLIRTVSLDGRERAVTLTDRGRHLLDAHPRDRGDERPQEGKRAKCDEEMKTNDADRWRRSLGVRGATESAASSGPLPWQVDPRRLCQGAGVTWVQGQPRVLLRAGLRLPQRSKGFRSRSRSGAASTVQCHQPNRTRSPDKDLMPPVED